MGCRSHVHAVWINQRRTSNGVACALALAYAGNQITRTQTLTHLAHESLHRSDFRPGRLLVFCVPQLPDNGSDGMAERLLPRLYAIIGCLTGQLNQSRSLGSTGQRKYAYLTEPYPWFTRARARTIPMNARAREHTPATSPVRCRYIWRSSACVRACVMASFSSWIARGTASKRYTITNILDANVRSDRWPPSSLAAGGSGTRECRAE